MAPCATTDGDSKQIAREALYGESRRGLCHVKPDAAAIEASGWRLPKPQSPEKICQNGRSNTVFDCHSPFVGCNLSTIICCCCRRPSSCSSSAAAPMSPVELPSCNRLCVLAGSLAATLLHRLSRVSAPPPRTHPPHCGSTGGFRRPTRICSTSATRRPAETRRGGRCCG